jgi:hypothetical protein
LPSGTLLQLQSTTQTSVVSTSSSSYVDIPGMSVNITPTSSSSKIFVQVLMGGAANSGITDFPVLRNGSQIANCEGTLYDNNDGNTMKTISLGYLDSPGTTSTLTYKVQWQNSGGTSYLNANRSGGGVTRTASITVYEIAG